MLSNMRITKGSSSETIMLQVSLYVPWFVDKYEEATVNSCKMEPALNSASMDDI